MHRTIFFIALTPMILTLAACNPTGPGPRMLTKEDAGRTANLKVGEHLQVALPANPTTGYTWEPKSLDTAILKQRDSKYTPDEVPPGLAGRGRALTLRFQAIGPGQTQLQLIYHRTFEPDTPPAKTFVATIVVSKLEIMTGDSHRFPLKRLTVPQAPRSLKQWFMTTFVA